MEIPNFNGIAVDYSHRTSLMGSLLCVICEDVYAVFVLGGNSYCLECFEAKKESL